MFRDHKVPAGPRPANTSRSPARSTKENVSPANNSAAAPTSAGTSSLLASPPMLSATSSNNHSLFSFNRSRDHGDVSDSAPCDFDFLPEVSFDDLQSSLETASTNFKLTQFPAPSGQGPILGGKPFFDSMVGPSSIPINGNGNASRAAAQSNPTPGAVTGRPTRSGSIVKGSGSSNRMPSFGSNVPASSSTVVDAPTAPAAMRHRRQSHYPPISNTGASAAAAAAAARPPRKSIGPGVIESDYGTRTAQKRRPSLISTASERESTARTSMETFSASNGDAATRATKVRSIQPPRLSATSFSASTGSNGNNSQLTPDGSRKSVLFPRSPRSSNTGGTPGSSRRASVMPGHGNHATGLGARTVSPTDAQRMRRMSLHQAQNLSSIVNAPPPTLDVARPNSRSPSMIPRKTSTPSSSRTTPDPNRKSYSSGLSIGSTASLNTHRTSTGSIQRGTAQNAPNSRLPAPKVVAIHNPPPPAEDEDDVPPVPAIPKAYESPKDSPAELAFIEKKKSSYSLDNGSIRSNSTGTVSNTPSFETSSTVQRRPSARKTRAARSAVVSDLEAKPIVTGQTKKNLAPLRLPPINLGPLSTPTAAKIAALKDHSNNNHGKSTPPANRAPKTPTTPMTAKATFFSRNHRDRDTEKTKPRSNSTFHHRRAAGSPNSADTASSSESVPDVPDDARSRKTNVSPFLSSSAPKNESNFGANIARSKTSGGDIIKADPLGLNNNVVATPQPKPTGPRAQMPFRPAKSPPPVSSPDEAQTPGSMSTLRRKLSLSWKRSASKSSHHRSNGSIDKTSGHNRQESMPPPRLPISATVGSMKSQSPGHAAKPSTSSYLESRRRKSSASSLTLAAAQEKAKPESWASVKKTSVDIGNSSMIETSTNSRTSSMQRILRPKSSAVSVRPEVYTADMDRHDFVADEEMKKLGSRRKETELAARTLDTLRKRATPKERVSPQDAIRIALLNIYERGEIVDYSDVYFCGTQNAAKVVGDLGSSAPNFGYDDDRGDYTIVLGDHLAYRYEVVDVLGKGSFGQVVRCIDHKTGVLVAVKIIRNKKRFHQQALVEVNILQKIREWDPKNRHSMVNFTHSFYFRGHLCISTELLDMNLYEFIKSNNFRGFSLKLIRRFTKQILSSLNMLKQHKVIHCDLKPENILLRHPMHSEIKVIDFGSSCFENEKVYTYIQSRFYRSPEVILGMTYGLPIDMWSVGCILAELYTGVPIFPGENEQEQLACIMEVFGPPEKHLIEKSTRKKLFFDSMGKPRLTVSSKGRRRRPSSKTLQQVLKCDDEAFLDFLARCLRWDPDRRIKPEEAIHHEFITGQKPSIPTSRVPTRDSSPMKRHHTISNPRPLPDPPAVSKPPVPRAAGSPHKPVVTARRASGITGPFTSGGMKRTSTGQTGISTGSTVGSSNLPRVAGRSVSAKHDLASAGATAAMGRRA